MKIAREFKESPELSHALEGWIVAPPSQGFAAAVMDKLDGDEVGVVPDGSEAQRQPRLRWLRRAWQPLALVASAAAISTLLWSAGAPMRRGGTEQTPEFRGPSDSSLPAASPGARRSEDPSVAPLASDTRENVAAYLDAYGRNYGPAFAFHGVVWVERGDEHFVVRRGPKKLGSLVPSDEYSQFALGTFSQQLIALGVMKLVEQGRLRLDDPLSRYLTGSFEGLRIEHLLAHRSGIPNFTDEWRWQWPTAEPLDLESDQAEILESLRQSRLDFAPGTRMEVSNANYVLLAAVIEALVSMPYDHWLQREIFAVAGMRSTEAGWVPRATTEAIVGLALDEAESLYPATPETLGYAGGLLSTVSDLAALARALGRGQLLGAESLAEIQRSRGNHYGLGWVTRPIEGRVALHHPGGMAGYSTYLALVPEDETIVVVMANSDALDASQVGLDIARSLYGAKLQAPHEYVEQKLDPAKRSRFVGAYELENDAYLQLRARAGRDYADSVRELSFWVREGELWLDVPAYGAKWAHPKGASSFFFKDRQGGIAEFHGAEGPARGVTLHVGETVLPYRRKND